jgi:hydrogenase maturation protease
MTVHRPSAGDRAASAPDWLIIGVGNCFRRDDGVGLVIAQRLGGREGIRATVRQESGEGTALLEAWCGADRVILLDAVSSDAEAGTVMRLDAAAQAIPARLFHCSSHAFGIAEAIALGRVLGRLPPRLIVYGVEGANFEAGVGLSPPVERAVTLVVQAVLDEIGVTPPVHRI